MVLGGSRPRIQQDRGPCCRAPRRDTMGTRIRLFRVTLAFAVALSMVLVSSPRMSSAAEASSSGGGAVSGGGGDSSREGIPTGPGGAVFLGPGPGWIKPSKVFWPYLYRRPGYSIFVTPIGKIRLPYNDEAVDRIVDASIAAFVLVAFLLVVCLAKVSSDRCTHVSSSPRLLPRTHGAASSGRTHALTLCAVHCVIVPASHRMSWLSCTAGTGARQPCARCLARTPCCPCYCALRATQKKKARQRGAVPASGKGKKKRKGPGKAGSASSSKSAAAGSASGDGASEDGDVIDPLDFDPSADDRPSRPLGRGRSLSIRHSKVNGRRRHTPGGKEDDGASKESPPLAGSEHEKAD